MSSPACDPVAQPFDAARRAATDLASHLGVDHHDVAVVLGSGWSDAVEELGETTAEVAASEIGGFPRALVAGHRSRIRSVQVGDRRVLVFLGRVHLYEGHHPNVVVHGLRTAVASGVGTVVLTNAAGSLRPHLPVGSPVLISDHLNLTGRNPLVGPNDGRIGPRFPDMTCAYPPRLRALARQVDPTLAEGVYAGVLGPNYETPAEVRMVAGLGADLVGMSTVVETVAAVHAGAEVLGLSLVTNWAAGLDPDPTEAGGLHHDHVLAVADDASPRLGALLAGIVERL